MFTTFFLCGTFVFKGPGKGDLPPIKSGAGAQSFAPAASNDQYLRVNCTGGWVVHKYFESIIDPVPPHREVITTDSLTK